MVTYIEQMTLSLLRMEKSIRRIETLLLPAGVAHQVEFYVSINGGPKQGVNVDLEIKKGDVVDLFVEFFDKNGDVAKVDGVPAWSASDDHAGKLEVSEDGMTAVLKSVAVGAMKIEVKADADVGAGVEGISGVMLLTILPLKAEKVVIGGKVR